MSDLLGAVEQFAALLRRAGLDPSALEIADALWLATKMPPRAERPAAEPGEARALERHLPKPEKVEKETEDHTLDGGRPEPHSERTAGMFLEGAARGNASGVRFRSPGATALPGALALARALRPLKRRVPSRVGVEIDEEATAERIAMKVQPAVEMRAATERWLDLALVVDEAGSMAVWQRTVAELRTMFVRLGAFRKITVHRLVTEHGTALKLLAGTHGSGRTPDLADAQGRRLILVLSDCVAPAWDNGRVGALLKGWGRRAPVAILQMLPERLWPRSGLGAAEAVRLRAASPGAPNHRLAKERLSPWFAGAGDDDEEEAEQTIAVPVIELAARSAQIWARMLANSGGGAAGGRLMATIAVQREVVASEEPVTVMTAELRVAQFRSMASRMARKLAALFAAAPLSLPVMRLIRESMLPEAMLGDMAEVYLGGLLREVGGEGGDAEYVRYDFHEGVRERLLDGTTAEEVTEVLTRVSEYVMEQLGSTLDFRAWLADPSALAEGASLLAQDRPFAVIGATVLRRLGGEYEKLAERISRVALAEGQQARSKNRKRAAFGGAIIPERYPIIQTRLEQRAAAVDSLSNDGGLLETNIIRELCAAMISADLGKCRRALFCGIDLSIYSELPVLRSISEQIYSDLYLLNKKGLMEDGSVPLQLLLQNAALLATPRVEEGVFQESLTLLTDALSARSPGASVVERRVGVLGIHALHVLYRAAVDLDIGSKRNEVFKGIAPVIVANIPWSSALGPQMLLDLDYLNRVGVFENNDMPLRTWIGNAIEDFKDRDQAGALDQCLRDLERSVETYPRRGRPYSSPHSADLLSKLDRAIEAPALSGDLISADIVDVLHRASLWAGLFEYDMRERLFERVSHSFVSMLPICLTPDAQIASDLDMLNKAHTLADGSVPLRIWLENAVVLTQDRWWREVFRRALACVNGATGIPLAASSEHVSKSQEFQASSVGGAGSRLFEHADILRIFDAALSAGLTSSRSALLAGLDQRVVADLPWEATPSDQVLSDLHHLNGMGRTPHGFIPIRRWLQNARTLSAEASLENRIFSDALMAAENAATAGEWLDAVPYPWQLPEANAMYDLLLAAYPEAGVIRSLARCTPIDLTYLQLQGSPDSIWRSLLEIAAAHGKLRALVDIVLHDSTVAAYHAPLLSVLGMSTATDGTEVE